MLYSTIQKLFSEPTSTSFLVSSWGLPWNLKMGSSVSIDDAKKQDFMKEVHKMMREQAGNDSASIISQLRQAGNSLLLVEGNSLEETCESPSGHQPPQHALDLGGDKLKETAAQKYESSEEDLSATIHF